jgi:hypothetical protein
MPNPWSNKKAVLMRHYRTALRQTLQLITKDLSRICQQYHLTAVTTHECPLTQAHARTHLNTLDRSNAKRFKKSMLQLTEDQIQLSSISTDNFAGCDSMVGVHDRVRFPVCIEAPIVSHLPFACSVLVTTICHNTS